MKQIKAIARKGKQLVMQLNYWDPDKIQKRYAHYNVYSKPEDIPLPEHGLWDQEINL